MDYSLIGSKQKKISNNFNNETNLKKKHFYSSLDLGINDTYQTQSPQSTFNPKRKLEQLNDDFNDKKNKNSTNHQHLIHLTTINNINTNQANTSIETNHFQKELQIKQPETICYQNHLPDFLSSNGFITKSIKIEAENTFESNQTNANYNSPTLSHPVESNESDSNKSTLPLSVSSAHSYLINLSSTNGVSSYENMYYIPVNIAYSYNYPQMNYHPELSNANSNVQSYFQLQQQQYEQNHYSVLNNNFTVSSQSVDQSHNYCHTTDAETSIRQFFPMTDIKNCGQTASVTYNNNKVESKNNCKSQINFQQVQVESRNVSQQVFGTFTASGEKIRRPPNAFMIFAKDRRREILYSNQKMTNKDVSKQLGAEWRNLSLAEKNHYKNLSEQLRLEHQIKYPGNMKHWSI